MADVTSKERGFGFWILAIAGGAIVLFVGSALVVGGLEAVKENDTKKRASYLASTAIKETKTPTIPTDRNFDLTAQFVSKDFAPDDPQAIFDAVRKIQLVKDEFESTDEYTKKYTQLSVRIFDEFHLKRLLVFRLKLNVRYDADAEQFSFGSGCKKEECHVLLEVDNSTDHDNANDTIIKLYGARRAQISWHKVIALTSSNARISKARTDWTLKVKRNDAKGMQNSLALLVIGSVSQKKPFWKTGFSYPNPENNFQGANWSFIYFDYRGVWLINTNTGEVLRKYEV